MFYCAARPQVCSWVMFCGLLAVTVLLLVRCLCRPDLVSIYETVPDETLPDETEAGGDGRRPSTDTFFTAASTPRRPDVPGPGGDGATLHTVSPLVHRSAEP